MSLGTIFGGHKPNNSNLKSGLTTNNNVQGFSKDNYLAQNSAQQHTDPALYKFSHLPNLNEGGGEHRDSYKPVPETEQPIAQPQSQIIIHEKNELTNETPVPQKPAQEMVPGLGKFIKVPMNDAGVVYPPRNITSRELEGIIKDNPDMRVLDLSNCRKIEDFTVLRYLPKELHTLNLSNTLIDDIKSIKHLTNLQSLDLKFTRMEDDDMPILGYLTGLRELILWGNSRVTNLRPLRELKNLQILDLEYTDAQDLSPLSRLNNLHTLHAEGIPLRDISPIKELTNLRLISFEEAFLGNEQLLNLRNLTKLEIINLKKCKISDISIMRNFPNLIDLELPFNTIVNVDPLSELSKIRRILLSNNPIGEHKHGIDPLKNLTTITGLQLTGAKIKNIDALLNMEKMKKLYLKDNRFLTDITPLRKMVKMEELYLTNCLSLRDISVLENCVSLMVVDLDQDPGVTDTSSLENLPDLCIINLAATGVGPGYISNLNRLKGLYGLSVGKSSTSRVKDAINRKRKMYGQKRAAQKDDPEDADW